MARPPVGRGRRGKKHILAQVTREVSLRRRLLPGSRRKEEEGCTVYESGLRRSHELNKASEESHRSFILSREDCGSPARREDAAAA